MPGALPPPDAGRPVYSGCLGFGLWVLEFRAFRVFGLWAQGLEFKGLGVWAWAFGDRKASILITSRGDILSG